FLPVAGSRPSSDRVLRTTSSCLPPLISTSTGEFQVPLVPGAFHFSVPSFLFSATTEPHSTPALTITRSLYSTGLVAEPHPSVPVPTFAFHSSLPLKSKAKTPDLPKNT